MADRAINMPLRVTGVGEVERDFKRVGDAGSKNFGQIEKSANGAAREVSEYHARLKRAAAEANRRMAAIPELSKGSADEIRTNQRDFRLGFINAEKDRILSGLPDLTRNYGQATTAATAFGTSLGTITALGAAAGAAIYALGDFVVDSATAFAEHERALTSFNAKLELSGNRSNATADEIKAMAAAVVEATGQTEEAALDAATTLAKVPGITKEGLAAALDVSSRLADALGEDVSKTAADTAQVLTALADNDMKALWKATDGLNDQLRVAVVHLAEAGKTAEAQKVYFEGLSRAAGNGPDGLTKATDQLSDAWNGLKTDLGKDIAGPASTGINWLRDQLKSLRGDIQTTQFSWSQLFKDVGAYALSPIGSTLKRGDRPFGRVERTESWDGKDYGTAIRSAVDSATQAVANAVSRAQVKALDEKYSKTGGKTHTGTSNTGSASLGDAVALIKTLFPNAVVTSTTGGQHAKGSDHYKGRAVDFVVPGMMTPEGTAEVERRMTEAGWDFRRNAQGTKQFFGPGRSASKPGDHNDHFHAAFDGSPSPERASAANERAREEAVRRQRAFEQESAGLDDEILRAKIAQVGDGSQLAQLAQQLLKIEGEKYAAGLDAKVKLGELTQAQADELKSKKDIVLALESQALTAQEQTRQIQEAFADQVAANDNQRELLSAQEGIATTADERRKLALALLKLDQEEERLRLQTVIDQGKIANATAEQRKAAEQASARLANLPTIEQAQTKSVERQNQTSLEKFIDDTDPKLIEEKANELAYDELMSVRRGINSAISSALGTDDPLITGLIELLLDQILFRPIAQALQNGMSSGGGGLGGLLGGLFGSIGGGLSSAGISAASSSVASTIAANPAIFAAGTPGVPTGRDFYVGENGRELMRYHGGGRLEVLSGASMHRSAEERQSGPLLVQHITIPERADPRRTGSSLARATQGAITRTARKGLAFSGDRR